MTIAEDIRSVLQALSQLKQTEFASGSQLSERSGILPEQINDAVRLLEDNEYVYVVRTIGDAPYDFSRAQITAGGRFELERATAEANEGRVDASHGPGRSTLRPVGSPFGFIAEDWAFIEREKQSQRLIVVFGHQFQSTHYNADALTEQLQLDFGLALGLSEDEFGSDLTLDFVPLRAGYGEHLFNQIARAIIASDIAVFETSDLNPNVMIEMGVALTWGTRVHPIRHADSPPPPSDISGQTWACYRNDGSTWDDGIEEYDKKLKAMVAQALRRKAAYFTTQAGD